MMTTITSESYVPRLLEATLRNRLASFPAVALTGPRQSGKSTLLRHVLPEYRYVTLDDPFVLHQAHEDPELLLGGPDERIIIDEIQYAPEIIPYIKMRIDSDRHLRGRFVLTGSQQFNLIRHLSESLAGRVGLLELLPFSIAELEGTVEETKPTVQWFEHACLRGLFPEPAMQPGIISDAWYESYLQTYLQRDIRSIYDIGNLREFDTVLRLLAARCSQQLNMSTLGAEAGVSLNTIKRWISILEACRIIYLLPPHFNNLGKRIIKAPKVYFTDCGLVCHLIRLTDFDHLMHGPISGALFENFCVQEAIKAALNEGKPPRFYYLRTAAGLEVDLLQEGPNGSLTPFEFKVSMTPKKDMAAQMTRFYDQFGELNPNPGFVVSLSDRQDRLTSKVSLLPFREFVGIVGKNA